MATPAIVGARHYGLAREIRRTLAQYAELKDIIAMLGLEQLSPADRDVVARARRLERFLTQPFFTTEQFTGLKGKLVRREDALDGCERILRDEFKDYPESALYMMARCSSPWMKECWSRPARKCSFPCAGRWGGRTSANCMLPWRGSFWTWTSTSRACARSWQNWKPDFCAASRPCAMTDEPTGKSSKNGPTLAGVVGAKAARKLTARRNSAPGVWFGLGMMGLVGWSVAVPTLLGAALGLWLDKQHSGKHSWTLALLAAGLVIGCLNAWHWVAKEDKSMHRERGDGDE